MKITEIYSSIQGETQYAGLPCTLVRTTGCDLRCGYCDTAYAFQGGREMSVAEIAAEVARLGPPLVLLTGGEPMLQRELPALAERLLADGRRVMIETSGAHRLDRLPAAVIRIVDVKTPASGESHRNRYEQLALLRPEEQIKFVLCDRADYEWSRSKLEELGLPQRCSVLFSPSHEQLPARELADWILADRLPVRLQIQLHKYLWGNERGR